MAESIYTVEDWAPGTSYLKNNIVLRREDIGDTGIPKKIKYYYAAKSSTGKTPPTNNDQYWAGYVDSNGVSVPLFTWTPSYNVTTSHKPRTLTVNFGNGYEERIPDGIFNTLISLSVSFDLRNETETTAILHFLRTRKGSESFIVQNLPQPYADIPEGGYRKKFICDNFSSTFSFHNNYSIKATFIQKNN